MKRLFGEFHLVRKNLLTLVGFLLCVYFSYHLIQGQRSLVRYMTLEQSTVDLNNKASELAAERQNLEKKVAMLRPGSINKDLLEERARIVLGFRRPGEVDVLSEQN